MPEEVARIAIDALADRLYAPTKLQASFLKEEGKKTSKVKVLGNVVVNSLKYIQAIQNVEMPLGIGRYALMTLHRQENIRTKALAEIMDAVQLIAVSESIKTVYWPCHPGAVTYAEAILGGSDDRGIIKLVPPMSYGHMIRAVQSAECVFTDSGGLQEETALLGKKCVTFRKSTERQETIVAGYNVLVSPLTHEFMDMVIQAIEHLRTPARPCAKMYGDDPAGLIAEDLKTWRTWI
jgi:UDP-N-acetylglucosamine 2-epimerase (non-hydrolysing)